MELELQNDLIDYISPKSLLFKEMMYEYFNRLNTFPGTDEFGNALEEIPVNALVSATFNHNVLIQAVREAGKLYSNFKDDFLNSQADPFQQFTEGKPHIKDDVLHNAYSLPVRDLLSLFNDSLKDSKQTISRPILHIGKKLEFYFEGHLHDAIYQPRLGGLPKKIVQVLHENFKKKPLTSGGLIMRIDWKKKLSPQDITSSIKDINEAFGKSSQLDHPIIINNSGYLFNDRHFDIILD